MKMTNKYQHNVSAKKVLMITGLSVVLGLASCQQEGPAEKVGQKLDRSIEKTEQKIEQTTEQTERKLDDAKKSITEKTETSEQYIDDSVITMNIKRAILNDPLLKVFQIKVTTVNGIVQLSGTLDSKESIDRAVEVVGNQKDVKSLQNDLVIKADVQNEE
ncbi:BON domain-containing protein [Nitrosomonas sp.]|uniref:BON domain-containing protein n=1 Tax=Nitrosomonas sp. TaxID=42353 RepID=UPI002604C136|nr:BON domain-containing protein [Nitrosomonas sp.]